MNWLCCRLMVLSICLSALTLSACGGLKNNAAVTENASDNTIENAQASLPPKPVEDVPEREAKEDKKTEAAPTGFVRSQLTNLWISDEMENMRPIAYMCPDDPSALPQYSISRAGVVYEVPVEGSISRLLCVIDDWRDLERIGNIRSARHYFIPLAYEWDAIFIHYGNPYYADKILASQETDNINGDIGTYRTSDRKAPQNAYASTERIIEAVEKLGYAREHTSFYQQGHYIFATETCPNQLKAYPDAKTAKRIDLSAHYPIDKPYFEYNEETGLYDRFQYQKPHIDAAFEDEQLSFVNIIIQRADITKLDANGYLDVAVTASGRDGYYITKGKAIHMKWEKENAHAATKYYDDLGDELILNTGKTMVCIINNDEKEPVIE